MGSEQEGKSVPAWKRSLLPWKYASRRGIIVRLVVSGVVAVVFMLPALLPTRVDALSNQYPVVEDRSRRHPIGDGKSLAADHELVTGTHEEQVEVPSSIPEKGLPKLKAVLTIPDGPSGRRPGVVILHGSGPSDRDGAVPGDLVARHASFPVYRALADLFAQEGLVVLRWDKRARKHYPELDTPEHRAAFEYADFERDGRDAVAWLASRPEVDPHAIVVVGHSEGGLFAPNVAAGEPHVAAVVLLGAFIDTFDAAEGQLNDFAGIRIGQLDTLGWITLRFKAWEAARTIATARAGEHPDNDALGGLTQKQLAAAIEYTEHTHERIRDLQVPTMALQGSADRNIAPDTIPRLAHLLDGHDAEVHYVAGVSHSLVDVFADPEHPALAPPVTGALRTFLRSVAWKDR